MPEIAVKIGLQLCDVVGYLHSHNPKIIHGDIKPNNIIVRTTGEICLIDYNLPQAYNDYMWPVGRTNGYSPPGFYYPDDWETMQREQVVTTVAMSLDSSDIFQTCSFLSGGKVKTRQLMTVQSDIYSIGATLYYCLSGRHLWPYERIDVTRMENHLGIIVRRCVERLPNERYSSTKHLSTVLSNRKTYEYDVALSFAGENREYVRQVARGLHSKGIKVFYDEEEQENLWGKNLYQHLDVVYQKRAKYCIVFISEHYKRKLWTKHEIQSVFARAFVEEREYFLPVIFDDTQLPGLRITTGYLDARVLNPDKIVKSFISKLTNSDCEEGEGCDY